MCKVLECTVEGLSSKNFEVMYGKHRLGKARADLEKCRQSKGKWRLPPTPHVRH